MNEKTAWENFCKTGKVKDYIKYTEIKNGLDFAQAMQKIESPMILSETDDNKNPRTYN